MPSENQQVAETFVSAEAFAEKLLAAIGYTPEVREEMARESSRDMILDPDTFAEAKRYADNLHEYEMDLIFDVYTGNWKLVCHDTGNPVVTGEFYHLWELDNDGPYLQGIVQGYNTCPDCGEFIHPDDVISGRLIISKSTGTAANART